MENIKKLVENGAKVNMKNLYGDSPLTISCEKENIESIKYLIEKRANTNICNSTGSSLLNILCKNNSINSLKIINYLVVEMGVDINSIDENNINPLLTLCYFNNEELLNDIIKNHKENININIQNIYKDTPLIISGYFNHGKIIENLEKEGANIALTNKYGETLNTIAKNIKLKIKKLSNI